jgi:hypothetical protein
MEEKIVSKETSKNMAIVYGNRYGELIFIPKVLDEEITILLIT